MKEYALYKGDTFIDLGSKKKLAERIGVKISTITFYMSPTYKKRGFENRYLVIKIEGEEE